MATKKAHSSAIKALQKELMELNAAPVEGFKVNASGVENMFIWDVAIFGPPMTLYEGGYFKARLFFPNDYPYSPPSIQFLSKMFHPNIYENGEVCISILHSPGEDPQSGELASERWNPTQNVRTILLSVISLLNEPNIHSAAYVEASVLYRRWKESKGKDNEYEKIVRSLVELTKADAEKDGVVVPTTLEEYCVSGRPGDHGDVDQSGGCNDISDFDDDDEYYTFDMDDDNFMDDGDDNDDVTTPLDGVDSAMEETEGDLTARPSGASSGKMSKSAISGPAQIADSGKSSATSDAAASSSFMQKGVR
ncbi:unnamed protein product [Calicophoron daubneyi]|uniref:UBC core domain-containing protein n=1 Tax=Calicophoron daubneyi TaxID=300641 RepID=A0AAV2TMG8_CALDB